MRPRASLWLSFRRPALPLSPRSVREDLTRASGTRGAREPRVERGEVGARLDPRAFAVAEGDVARRDDRQQRRADAVGLALRLAVVVVLSRVVAQVRIRPAENYLAARSERPGPAASPSCRLDGSAAMVMRAPVVTALTPNVLSVRHWDRLLGGLLYAASPRIDWASLLRRTLHVDVLQCPKCHGRLRVLAVITERDPVTRILSHLGLPTRAPPLARARDPSDELADIEPHAQLELGLA